MNETDLVLLHKKFAEKIIENMRANPTATALTLAQISRVLSAVEEGDEMSNEKLQKMKDEPNPAAVYVDELSYELIKTRELYALRAFQKVGINPDVIIEQDALISKLKAQLRAVAENLSRGLVEYTETEAYNRAGFYYDRDDVLAMLEEEME